MDASVFEKKLVRPALLSIALYLLVIAILSMTMVKPAQANGSVPVIILPRGGATQPFWANGGVNGSSTCGIDTTIDGVGKKCEDAYNSISRGWGLGQTYTYTGYTLSNIIGYNSYGLATLLYTISTSTATSINQALNSVYLEPLCPHSSTFDGSALCNCDAGYMPNPSATSCVPGGRLTITLQNPLADVQPSGTADVYANTSSTVYAQVIDAQTSQPKAGVQVKFSVDVIDNSGGHDGNHYQMRPKGKLLDCGSGSEVETTVCMTQQDGRATVTFNASSVSGTHTITAGCVNPACTGMVSGQINVKVPGLGTIPASQFYTFVGATDKHSDNHYLTPEAASVLWRLAATYYFKYRQDTSVPLLQLNDASLVWGGRFDVNGNWANPHAGHRKGTVIDIRANALPTAIPERLFTDFEDMAAKTLMSDGVTAAKAQLHCSKGFDPATNCVGDNNRHFHVLLLGVDQ